MRTLERMRLSLGGGILGSAVTSFWTTNETEHLLGALIGIALAAAIVWGTA